MSVLVVRHPDEVRWWFRAGGFLPDTLTVDGDRYTVLAEDQATRSVRVRIDPAAPFPLSPQLAQKAVYSLTFGIPTSTDGLGPAMLDRCVAHMDEALRLHAAAGTDGSQLQAMRTAWAQVREATPALDLPPPPKPLSDGTATRILREVLPGRPALEAVKAAADRAPLVLHPLARVKQSDGRRLAWMVCTEPDDDAPRMGLLGMMTTERDQVLDRVLLTGEALLDQQQRLTRAMGMNPEDSEARAKARVEEIFAALEAQLRPALQAAVQGDSRADRIHALLQPRPGDAAKAFGAPLAPTVEAATARMWEKRPPRMKASGDQTELRLSFATVGALVEGLSVAGPFPLAYRSLAPHLVDGRVWATWVYHRPGEPRGMRYDGLVWLDDHWAWFPKPWRMVRHLLAPN